VYAALEGARRQLGKPIVKYSKDVPEFKKFDGENAYFADLHEVTI